MTSESIKVWSPNQEAWMIVLRFISTYQPPKNPIWKEKYGVFPWMAKHEWTWIHLAANYLNMRLSVIQSSTYCKSSCTSHNYRTINSTTMGATSHPAKDIILNCETHLDKD